MDAATHPDEIEHALRTVAHSARISWPRRSPRKIRSVFLPYMGCPGRCVFCAQDLQTGHKPPAGEADARNILRQCQQELEKLAAIGRPAPELAFYGGTFTALPDNIWHLCLLFAQKMYARQLISGFRCSTRPDCLPENRVKDLLHSGCQLVELGIQSFQERPLELSGRGYGPEQALQACRQLRTAGLGPGIQLMPGMPGSSQADFMADVRIAATLHAACLRFYPCLVLAGSRLHTLWRQGLFSPWSLDAAIDALAKAWLLALNAGIPVIRMGLAPEAGLDAAVAAGPAHPALGSRVMGRALLFAVRNTLTVHAAFEIFAPRSCQGFFWGWRGELAGAWCQLGLQRAHFWQKDYIYVQQN